ISRRRCKPQQASSRRSLAVLQKTLELHEAALAGLQKRPELPQQRLERPENGLVTLQLVGEVAFAAEALARPESFAQIRIPPREPVQHREGLRPETLRKSRTGQTQRLP